MNGFQSPPRSPRSPRSSGPPSPSTPRQRKIRGLNGSNRVSGDYSLSAIADGDTGGGDGGGGLGSLADELADAWEEDEEDGYGYASGIENAPAEPQRNDSEGEGEDGYIEKTDMHGTATLGTGIAASPECTVHQQHLKQRLRNGHNRYRRHESSYDGSDYGNDSDLEEAADISPGLENQMAEVESLARRGLENNGSDNDHVVKRTVESLRELGAQSAIENSAMRLITAHTSIASHLTSQTRALQTLAHPLLLSHFPLLSTDAVDSLIPLIDEGLLPNLPYPYPSPQQQQQQSSRPATPSSQSSSLLDPLASLQALITQTADLNHSLRGLSDTLYEARQLTSTASRRLRSARELVAELRREEEGREEGTRWIERGDWDRRLREREAGRVCGEVVSGFEEVCGQWRERLFGTAAAPAGTEAVAG